MELTAKILKGNILLAIFAGLILFGCESSNVIDSDLKLVPDNNFGEVYVNPKSEVEIIFNVDGMQPFNYVHIMFADRFFVVKHKSTDSLLTLNRKTLIPKDTVGVAFENFEKGQNFQMIMGTKQSSDAKDLSINAAFAVNVILGKSG